MKFYALLWMDKTNHVVPCNEHGARIDWYGGEPHIMFLEDEIKDYWRMGDGFGYFIYEGET